MADNLLEKYIQQLLESNRTPEVTIAWQGGEPTLMGLDFFKRSVEYAQKYKQPGQRVAYTMQTNGTKLDDEWCAFFKEHNFLIGLSVDGPQHIHDAYRVDKGGKGTFDQVMRGKAYLDSHGVDVNILCTVHAANQQHPLEVYRFFRDELKAEFIQFIPIVERMTFEMLPQANAGWGERGSAPRPLYILNGDRTTDRSVQPEPYGDFLIQIFNEWVRRDVGKIYVQIFDSTLGAHIGQYSLCIFAPTCGNALAIEHNGDLYSCDHFVEPDYLLGKIQETHMIELIASDQQRQFGRDKMDTLPIYCQKCEVRFACNGGCPKNRFIRTPDGEQGLNYLCAGYKAFFRHTYQPMRIMATLLQQDRAPADIMHILANEELNKLQKAFANSLPDDPCPCGSGKTFKRCHGKRG